MSILDWSHKGSTIPHYLRDEEEAYSLPIILRLEKGGDSPSHEKVLEATAYAIAQLFDDERTVSDPVWKDSLETWMRGRIRKVARRARTSAWDKVKESENVYINFNNVEICILPPHPVDTTPDVIRKLQVAGLDLPSEPQANPEANLLLAVNPFITMTTGKSMAQIGHATQLAIFNSSEDVLARWKADNFATSFTAWDSFPEWTAEIQDAGFTEVEPGTFTTRSILR